MTTKTRRAAREKAPSATSRQAVVPTNGTLSERERRFVESYMGVAAGNASKAATLAGYSPKTARFQGSHLLTKPNIRAAIDERAQRDPRIATREDLQQWWTAMFKNPALEDRDRLKASELLGKSQAVFVDRHQLEAGGALVDLLARVTVRTERP